MIVYNIKFILELSVKYFEWKNIKKSKLLEKEASAMQYSFNQFATRNSIS